MIVQLTEPQMLVLTTMENDNEVHEVVGGKVPPNVRPERFW